MNLGQYIIPAIFLLAFAQAILIITILVLSGRQTGRLADDLLNLTKGMPDAPDHDRFKRVHELITVHLDFIAAKLIADPSSKAIFRQNARRIMEKGAASQHYSVESLSSLSSTIVQIFPLLGILGTILSIGNVTLTETDTITATSLTEAFVLAIDSTVLGIAFAILFMFIDALQTTEADRIVEESHRQSEILTSIFIVGD